MEQSADYHEARNHSEHALFSNHNHIPTIYSFTARCIRLGARTTCERLLSHVRRILGINRVVLWQREALLKESVGDFNGAIECLKEATDTSLCDNE